MNLALLTLASAVLVPLLPLWVGVLATGLDRSTTLPAWIAGLSTGIVEVLLLVWLTQGHPWHPIARFALFSGAACLGAPLVAYVLWKVILGDYTPGR